MLNNKTDLYISAWWGNYVGGCDDSLLLLDYFKAKKSPELSLKNVLDDLNLTVALKSNDWENNALSWKANERFQPDFDLVASVVIDLSAIVLESIKSGKIDLNLLDSYNNGTFVLQIDTESLKLLLSGLSFFIESKHPFCGFGYVMDLDQVEELIQDCKAIRDELKRSL